MANNRKVIHAKNQIKLRPSKGNSRGVRQLFTELDLYGIIHTMPSVRTPESTVTLRIIMTSSESTIRGGKNGLISDFLDAGFLA